MLRRIRPVFPYRQATAGMINTELICRRCPVIELKSAAGDRADACHRAIRRQVLSELADRGRPGVNLLDLEHHAREHDQRARRRVLLLGLRAVLRQRAVPQRHLPVRQRRRAARAAARLRAARRRRAEHGLRGRRSTAGWPTPPARSIVGTPPRRTCGWSGPPRRRWRPASGPRSRATGSATSPRRSARWPPRYGYPVNTEFGGHGLGRTMHEDPHVPNSGRAGRGLKLQPGPDHRPGAVVRPHHRPDGLRPGRLDHPLRRRLPHGALRAHGGGHRKRAAGPDPAPPAALARSCGPACHPAGHQAPAQHGQPQEDQRDGDEGHRGALAGHHAAAACPPPRWPARPRSRRR